MLAGAGHDVTWWTSTFSHSQKRFHSLTDRVCEVDGVRLHLLQGPGYGRNLSVARFRHHAHFAERLSAAAMLVPRPHVVLTPIPTLEVADRMTALAASWGVPAVVDIRDEWPDELVRLAPAPLRGMARLAMSRWFQMGRRACGRATSIWGISHRQLAYGASLAGRDLHAGDAVMPLGYAPARQDPAKVAEANRWWDGRGLRRDAFVVCFFGTIGHYFDLDTVIRAAAVLDQEMPVQFVLCGDGSKRARFASQATGQRSVLLPGWVTAPQIAALMGAAAAGLAPYRAGAEAFSLPNKPFEYMAGGLPVISSVQGELRDLLREHDCGLTYRGDSVDDLVDAVRRLQAAPAWRQAMGGRGRALIEREYSTDVIFRRMEASLMSLARSGS